MCGLLCAALMRALSGSESFDMSALEFDFLFPPGFAVLYFSPRALGCPPDEGIKRGVPMVVDVVNARLVSRTWGAFRCRSGRRLPRKALEPLRGPGPTRVAVVAESTWRHKTPGLHQDLGCGLSLVRQRLSVDQQRYRRIGVALVDGRETPTGNNGSPDARASKGRDTTKGKDPLHRTRKTFLASTEDCGSTQGTGNSGHVCLHDRIREGPASRLRALLRVPAPQKAHSAVVDEDRAQPQSRRASHSAILAQARAQEASFRVQQSHASQ